MIKITIEGCEGGPITKECSEFIVMCLDSQDNNTVLATERYFESNPDVLLVAEKANQLNKIIGGNI